MNGPSKLKTLDVWWHDGVRSAAENLAFDESLLSQLDDRPMLRFYQWSHDHGEPWTMGYFQRWAEMPFATEQDKERDFDLDIARRWTGGGLVCHRGDFPYTLTAPADHWLAKLPATESYRWIHERLAASIRESTGMDAVERPVVADTPSASPAPASACFEKPVHWDVIIADGDGGTDAGKKIAGAAQRRSRGRLLHQGSVILPGLDNNEDGERGNQRWRSSLVKRLCSCPQENWSPNEQLIAEATKLVSDRYGSRLWRERF